MQIANLSTRALIFRDKAGEVVEIAPGDAQNVDVARDHPVVVARENARLIRVGGSEAQAKKLARTGSPEAAPVAAAKVPTDV